MSRGLAEGARVTPRSSRNITAACWLVSTGGRGTVYVGWVLVGLVRLVHRVLRGVVGVNRLRRMIDVYRLGRIVGVQRLRGIVGVQRLRGFVGIQRLRWMVGVYRLRRMVDILWRIITNVLRLIVVVLDRVVVVVGGVGRGRTVDRWEESRTGWVGRVSPVSVHTFLLLLVEEASNQERSEDTNTNTHHCSINQSVAGTEDLGLVTGSCSCLLLIFRREDFITAKLNIKLMKAMASNLERTCKYFYSVY